jgi:hypothetical protein
MVRDAGADRYRSHTDVTVSRVNAGRGWSDGEAPEIES